MRFFLIFIALVGLFGFFALGSIGVLLGTILSAIFGYNRPKRWGRPNQRRRIHAQSAFFKATFLVMGKLAKADGRVNQQEIDTASYLMNEVFRLNKEQREQAIDLFNQGKQADEFTIKQALRELRQSTGFSDLIETFLELQLQAAYADGRVGDAELGVLYQVCDDLNVSRYAFGLLHQRVKAQRAFAKRFSSGTYHEYHTGSGGNVSQELREAYAILGVSEGTPFLDIKKAYRRLMKEHHPDKMIAKGLPDSMLNLAKERTQKIQAAYDLIQNYEKSGVN